MKIHEIQRAVSEEFGISQAILKSDRRSRKIARARFAGYWLAREITTASFALIGRMMQRDHTTILHGCTRADYLMEQDAEFREKVQKIRVRLENSPINSYHAEGDF